MQRVLELLDSPFRLCIVLKVEQLLRGYSCSCIEVRWEDLDTLSQVVLKYKQFFVVLI